MYVYLVITKIARYYYTCKCIDFIVHSCTCDVRVYVPQGNIHSGFTGQFSTVHSSTQSTYLKYTLPIDTELCTMHLYKTWVFADIITMNKLNI